jgi:hypothetical protein
MAIKKREPMQFAPPTPVNGATLGTEPSAEPEAMVKLGVMIYKSLNKRLNLEAANREVKKQDLVNEILAHYFDTQDEEDS